MKLLIEVSEMQHPPRGYGAVRYDAVRRLVICAPIPLNFVFAVADRVHMALVRGLKPSRYESDIAKAQAQGFVDALRYMESNPIRRSR